MHGSNLAEGMRVRSLKTYETGTILRIYTSSTTIKPAGIVDWGIVDWDERGPCHTVRLDVLRPDWYEAEAR